MPIRYKHILIIADIEGSSGCLTRRASRFMNPEWAEACLAMSRDVDAVAGALFDGGVETITVKDFHRTAYNLLPEYIHPRTRIIHGYKRGPVIGLGNPGGAQAVMFLGLHAPSGSDGFLAHTLTSRISRLEVNGELMSEAQLFSASLFPYGVRPIFFSGCPAACDQAKASLPGILTWPIRKIGDEILEIDVWRRGLAEAAVQAAHQDGSPPYAPQGPFSAAVSWRDGQVLAEKLARRWGWPYRGDTVFVESPDIHDLYLKLGQLAYLNRVTNQIQGPSLFCYRQLGRVGLTYVRRKLKARNI